MSTHVWVRMQYMPLIVEPGPLESLQVYVSKVEEEAAVQQSVDNCWFCHTLLTVEAFNLECPYEQNDGNLDTDR